MDTQTEPTTVAPALTADEWDVRGRRAGADEVRVDHGMLFVMRYSATGWTGQHTPLLAETMALANAARADGDPGKITSADAQWLASFAKAYRHEWGDGEWGGESGRLDRIAAKLAALLPPAESPSP